MKNSNNHIDELFQNGIEQAEIQPPQELWNQVSQSWDQILQADIHSNSQTSSSTTSAKTNGSSVQGSSLKMGGFSQWSSLSKWILGVVGTTVVGGGIYLVAELASPEIQIQKINSTAVKSNQQPESSTEFSNSQINSQESTDYFKATGQTATTSEFKSSNSCIDTQLTVIGSKLNSNNDGSHVKQELTSPVDQKAAANHKDILHNEYSKGMERTQASGVKAYLELVQRNIRVEQIENRVQVKIDGVSGLNAVIKSVVIGKEKIQSVGNSSFVRGDMEGWDLPDDGSSLVFERKCYLETSKKLNIQIALKIVDADKVMGEKECVVEKNIEFQPWIAGGIEIIPNVFTPNGDGLNDEYYVKVREPKSFQMEISSAERSDLGTVFYTNSILERWNGKKGEINCPEGKYWVSIRRVYERIDNQGKWITATKVERILMELKRD